MAWYLRKSVSVGPIRLNLSKSGVGASVGVTGFRIGIRPNGSSYIQAGRHGFYVREELGGGSGDRQVITSHLEQSPPTQKFDAVSSVDLSDPERKEFIDRLNKSYKGFRLDYFVFLVTAVVFGAALLNESLIGIAIAGTIGLILGVAAVEFESRRRTIRIFYDFESGDTSSFSELVKSINHLAECSRLWAYVDSRDLSSGYESKIHAGASSLVKREPAAVGAGMPPWVETNVSVPTIKARGITLYFMPDAILVYDINGVGCIGHTSLLFSASTECFIENEAVPPDAEVVDRTWKFANVRGGPDRRFKNNKEIPICLYGTLNLSTSAGLLFYLQTSKKDAPCDFSEQYAAYLETIWQKNGALII